MEIQINNDSKYNNKNNIIFLFILLLLIIINTNTKINNYEKSKDDEQHIHEHQHEEFGTSLSRAIAGGAITGLASSIGVKGGEYLGNMASTGITTNSALSASVNAGVKAATMSYSTSIGTAMSNTAIYGGDFNDVMKAGWKSAGDKDTWESVAITGAVVGGLTYFVNATGGKPNTNSGSYKDSKMGINTIKDVDGKVYLENMPGIKGEELTGFDKTIYDSKIFSIYDNNPIMKGLNTIPTLESGVAWHDLNMGFIEQELGVNFGTQMIKMGTAIPYLLINSCVASPEICSVIINSDNFKININKDFKQ